MKHKTSENQINEYIQNINKKINENLQLIDFSKFDYFKKIINT